MVLCKDAQAGCADGSAAAVAEGGVIKVKAGLTDEEFKTALGGPDVAKHKVSLASQAECMRYRV